MKQNRASYLNASILCATVEGLVDSGVDHSEDVAHIMMGVDGIEALKCPCRPYLWQSLSDHSIASLSFS